MIQAINCPSCGAQLQFDEDQTATNCQYCGSRVSSTGEALPAETQKVIQIDWKTNPIVRLVLLLAIIVFVLPACLGLVATLFGAMISLLAPLIVIILQSIR
jgi:uncharacterized membrane protein YvbJ